MITDGYKFHENYQINNKYNLVKADIKTTIQMALSIFLGKNVHNASNSSYGLLRENADTIINYFMDYVRNYDIVIVTIFYDNYDNTITMYVDYSDTNMANQIIWDKQTSEGFTYYSFSPDDDGEYLDIKYIAGADLQYPSISYWQNSSPSVDPPMKIGALVYNENNWFSVELSNLGIDFD